VLTEKKKNEQRLPDWGLQLSHCATEVIKEVHTHIYLLPIRSGRDQIRLHMMYIMYE